MRKDKKGMLIKDKYAPVFHILIDQYNELLLECQHMAFIPWAHFAVLRRSQRYIENAEKLLPHPDTIA